MREEGTESVSTMSAKSKEQGKRGRAARAKRQLDSFQPNSLKKLHLLRQRKKELLVVSQLEIIIK